MIHPTLRNNYTNKQVHKNNVVEIMSVVFLQFRFRKHKKARSIAFKYYTRNF